MSTDVLKIVIDSLESALGCWVSDTFPTPEELRDNLPCVTVDELPGAVATVPWGGLGQRLEGIVLDIDVYAPSRAQTRQIREQIHDILANLPYQAWSPIVEVSPLALFHTRPDFNRNIRRVGAEYQFLTR